MTEKNSPEYVKPADSYATFSPRVTVYVFLLLVGALVALPHNLRATTSNAPHTRTPVLTADDYIRTDFTVEDGLPNNIIQALVQTQNGVLWVGTESGLASFDGRTFRPINLQTQGSPPMGSVHSLLESSEGDLWVGCEAGVVRIPKRGLDQFTSTLLTYFQVGSGSADEVEVLLQSRDGTLWAGTKHGLFREVSGKFVSVISSVSVNPIVDGKRGKGAPEEFRIGTKLLQRDTEAQMLSAAIRQVVKTGNRVTFEEFMALRNQAVEWINSYHEVYGI